MGPESIGHWAKGFEAKSPSHVVEKLFCQSVALTMWFCCLNEDRQLFWSKCLVICVV